MARGALTNGYKGSCIRISVLQPASQPASQPAHLRCQAAPQPHSAVARGVGGSIAVAPRDLRPLQVNRLPSYHLG